MSDPHGGLLLRMREVKRLEMLLRSSRLGGYDPVPLRERSLWKDDEPDLPHWPSGFGAEQERDSFDRLLRGFNGLTVLCGESGTGKSTAALACAFANVLDPGTFVAYLDAENPIGTQVDRSCSWWGSRMKFQHAITQGIDERFFWFEVLPGMTWTQLMNGIAERITSECQRLLIVLDSVNSLARIFPGHPLANTSAIYMAAQSLVRPSVGAIRILALSELNGNRDLKGLEGVYMSSLALKLLREPEFGPTAARMSMLKNRAGAFVQDLGIYDCIPERCRLEKRSDGIREEDSPEKLGQYGFGV